MNHRKRLICGAVGGGLVLLASLYAVYFRRDPAQAPAPGSFREGYQVAEWLLDHRDAVGHLQASDIPGLWADRAYVMDFARTQVAFERALNTPITFYGKVIDGDGNPLPYASVKVKAETAPSSALSIVSGPDGRFEINNAQGRFLEVDVQKENFALRNETRTFWYSGSSSSDIHVPTKESPVIFQLWDLSQTDPLKVYSTKKVSTRAGQVLCINVATGTFEAPGDVQVKVRFDSSAKQARYDDLPVEAQVEAQEGAGVTEFLIGEPTRAPTDGWKTRVPFTQYFFRGSGSPWFYVKTKAGKYAAVGVFVERSGDGISGTLKIYYNPTGRRMLIDPPAHYIMKSKERS